MHLKGTGTTGDKFCQFMTFFVTNFCLPAYFVYLLIFTLSTYEI